MTTIKNLYDRFEKLDTDKVIDSALKQTKDYIGALNKEQMNKGLRSDGSETTPTYKDSTIRIKIEKGQPVDRVTLKDTGAFYAGVKVEVKVDTISIFSTDSKSEKLEKEYSKANGGIFGLSKPFKREYLNEALRPEIRQRIQKETGLSMK
jgi:transcriptional regulator